MFFICIIGYLKWTKFQVIEWLSFIYDKDIPLSEIYEKNFIEKQIDGSKLSYFSEKEFLQIGVSDVHSKILNEEVEKLIQNDCKLNTTKNLIFQYRFQH